MMEISPRCFRERRQPIDVAKMQSQLAEMNSALERLRYQRRLEPLLEEIPRPSSAPRERLVEVKADPAFRHLPDGTLQWDENYEALSAYRLAQSPNLDGDFSKWDNGPMYRLDERAQVVTGAKLWKGPQRSCPRAWRWRGTQAFFYVGVDVIDPDLYQTLLRARHSEWRHV